MRGLVCGFSNCVAFVDGTKQRIYRPMNEGIQEDNYCGQHHFTCHTPLHWTDIYGVIIRLDITGVGSEYDRRLYNDRNVIRFP